jgi:Tetratricopeptide repeat
MAKAKPIAERAIAIDRQHLGENDPQTAWALDTLAIVFRSSEEGSKAEKTLKEVIATTRKSLGENHPKMVEYRSQLGWRYEHRGDYTDAILELQGTLAVANQSLDPEDFWWIAVRHNLGDLYLIRSTGRAYRTRRTGESRW